MNRGLINSKYLVSSDVSLLNPDKVRELLHACIWSKHVPISYIKKFITTSLCFGVYEKSSNEQLGFSRVISDGMSYSYVTDVVVDARRRKHGLGSLLFEAIVNHHWLRSIKSWSLRSTKDSERIYKNFGFDQAKNTESIFELVNLNIYCEEDFIDLHAKASKSSCDSGGFELSDEMYYITTHVAPYDIKQFVGVNASLVTAADCPSNFIKSPMLYFVIYYRTSRVPLGFIRVISDFTTHAYIADVVLDKVSDKNEYSNALTFLLESIRRHPELQGLREWRVIVDDNTRPIFAKFGFMKAEYPETIFEKSAD